MTSEMLNKLNSFIFLLFPEFNMSVHTGCDNEICSTKAIGNTIIFPVIRSNDALQKEFYLFVLYLLTCL